MFSLLTVSENVLSPSEIEDFRESVSIWGQLRLKFLGISLQEATFTKRGFSPSQNPHLQNHLEQIGQTFLSGYHTAIAFNEPSMVIQHLQKIAGELQGFAFEGAAMGLTLLDWLMPWQPKRIPQFLALEGDKHIYMTYVGLGWALARIPLSLNSYLAKLDHHETDFPDPLLGWLALDGYGFHQGYFAWQKYIEKQTIPQELSGYALRVFDQGLGRSLWFVKGANVDKTVATINRFATHRQADLWSGVGLACTYAGKLPESEIKQLRELSGKYRINLAQGSAFASKARLRANNLTENTEVASQILSEMSAQQSALITDQTLIGLDFYSEIPAYEQWRQRIQLALTK